MSTQPSDTSVQNSIVVDAPIDQAFSVFTDDFGSFKPREHNMLPVDIAETIADSSPPGSICVSDDFAAVLAAGGAGQSEASWIGEIQARDGGPAIGLYSLKSGVAS